jgi:hypothetical protein
MDQANYLRAHGLPAQFNDYLANGRPVERGEPARSETVAPQERLRVTRNEQRP